ncbi:hypothetical protein ACEYYA_02635 [Paracoccus sp. p3-h83]|uniref:hypothetical protein n=1 Tax=Paracoccus sp. p3-h83 TaxID=3342805 RepID=UPI0035B84AA4
MIDYRALAYSTLPEEAAATPEDLTPAQVLEGCRRYYADVAADEWENIYLRRLSTLDGMDGLTAALVVARWLVTGPEAVRVLAGGRSELIEAEAAIISLVNPTAPVTALQLATEIDARFRAWVGAAAFLSGLRQAAQIRIYQQTTPEACEATFAMMRAIADELVQMTLAGATKEAVMARLAERLS